MVWNLYGLNGERLETHQYTLGLYFFVYNGQAIPVYFTTSDTLVSRNLYFGGRLIQSNGQTVLTDRLGTVRANESGARAAYYPYGEQQGGGIGDGREKFATYTREVGSGLDYAGQRYFSPVYGRFTSADRYSASAAAGDPADWCSSHPYDAACASATTGFLPTSPVLAGSGAGGVGIGIGVTIGSGAVSA